MNDCKQKIKTESADKSLMYFLKALREEGNYPDADYYERKAMEQENGDYPQQEAE